MQHSTARCNTALHVATQHGTLQRSTARRNTARHVATQHGTLQRSTLQHSTARAPLSGRMRRLVAVRRTIGGRGTAPPHPCRPNGRQSWRGSPRPPPQAPPAAAAAVAGRVRVALRVEHALCTREYCGACRPVGTEGRVGTARAAGRVCGQRWGTGSVPGMYSRVLCPHARHVRALVSTRVRVSARREGARGAVRALLKGERSAESEPALVLSCCRRTPRCAGACGSGACSARCRRSFCSHHMRCARPCATGG